MPPPNDRRAKRILNFFDDNDIRHSTGRAKMKSDPGSLPPFYKVGGRYYVAVDDEEVWRSRQIAATCAKI
jgi:hypothetical protein